jgi:hypothetical protein
MLITQSAAERVGQSVRRPNSARVIGKNSYITRARTRVLPTKNRRVPTAAYWNTDSRGLVCAGSMRVPESSDITSIPAWQDAYFR